MSSPRGQPRRRLYRVVRPWDMPIERRCTAAPDKRQALTRHAESHDRSYGPHPEEPCKARRLEGWSHALQPAAILRDARKSALLRTRALVARTFYQEGA